jgi:predicted negative regulator of RcsB-dependent stress response
MTSSGSYANSAKLTLTITHKLAKVTVSKKKKDDGLEEVYTTSEEEISYTFAKTYTIDFSKVDNVYVAS